MNEPAVFHYLSHLEIAIGAFMELWPYIAAVTGFLAAFMIWLKKMGWIHIGKELERRREPPCNKYCGEHGTHSKSITQIGTRVNGLERKIDNIDRKLDKSDEKLDQLIGKVSIVHREVMD